MFNYFLILISLIFKKVYGLISHFLKKYGISCVLSKSMLLFFSLRKKNILFS